MYPCGRWARKNHEYIHPRQAEIALHCPLPASRAFVRFPSSPPHQESALAKTPNFKQEKKRREDMQKKRNEEKQRQQAARKENVPPLPKP